MDNVLIALDSSESSFWLAFYAVGLTRRVKANVSILMVVDEELMNLSKDDDWIGLPERRLESLIAEEGSDQARIAYYVAHGSLEQEILHFVWENGITILVISRPSGRDPGRTRRFLEMLERINKQTNCHIEVVQKVAARRER
ncbi:MAG: universal stress protein [Desulfovibrio sp.]